MCYINKLALPTVETNNYIWFNYMINIMILKYDGFILNMVIISNMISDKYTHASWKADVFVPSIYSFKVHFFSENSSFKSAVIPCSSRGLLYVHVYSGQTVEVQLCESTDVHSSVSVSLICVICNQASLSSESSCLWIVHRSESRQVSGDPQTSPTRWVLMHTGVITYLTL